MPDEQQDTAQYVFVDEAGGTELDTTSETLDFYVICGILVSQEHIDGVRLAASNIIRTHAGKGELKSSRIGSNTERRQRILYDIAGSNLSFYSLAVNKSAIYRDSGLRWRPSFYKFLHQMFYSRIKGAFMGIHVLADQYGSSEFMSGFQKYVSKHSSLFDQFHFQASGDVPLLQIADVIAGTIRRVFLNQDPIDLLKTLGYPSVPIEEWPPMSTAMATGPAVDADQFDQLILQASLDAARNFVESQLQSDNGDKKLQAEVVRYLLSRLDQDPDEYVYRSEIVNHVRSNLGIVLSEQTLSQKVFAAARDEGVIISSTENGVKIPSNVRDVRAWIDRVSSQVVPYLHRIEAVRTAILMRSHNKYDIVDSGLYPALASYLTHH